WGVSGGGGARIAAPAGGLALLAAERAPAASAQSGSSGVSIPDPSLRNAIESTLGKQPGATISQAEMAGLGSLDASYSNVQQVEGLQHAVNLRALYLQGNRISDASSLANLARMRVLALNGNDISEIDITRMTNLGFLDLGNNELASIDLSGQRTRVGENAQDSRLYALWLHNNRLTSIDLSGLTALQDRPDGASHPSYVSLRLDRNRLKSVTGLRDLPTGAWSLKLEHNQLTSVDLRGAEHLHYLYLNNNPISSTADLAGFSALSGLRRLYLYETEISSIDLSRFSRLQRVFLNDNRLTSVDVTGLDSVQRLWLRGNQITQVTGLSDIGDTLISLNLRSNRLSSINLSGLSSIRQLYLSDNALTAVELAPLTQLDVLWLHNGVSVGGSSADPAYQNQITSLGTLPRWITDLRLAGNPLAAPIPLASRAGLRKLYVSGGQISGLPALAGLTGLTELGLRDMDLTGSDLSMLPSLPALQKLDLRDNSIADLAALASFERLTELRLDDNFVSDVSPLRNMTALDDLYVAGNVIMDSAPLRHLILAGLTVHGGDQQRGDSPDNFFWDIDASGSLHGWNLSQLEADGVLDNTECGLDLICPGLALERWVVAIWLVRVLDGDDPEPLGYNRFEDVHPGLQWAAHVERLAELEIVAGCSRNPSNFCPQNPVTRAQMATLLARAFNLQPDAPSTFVDIDREGPHADDIDAIAATGVTMGCGAEPDRFCPDDLVTRGQAATFIVRARDYAAGS
ncbi:MAG: S-layer homology domain-containing protein, partial [Acidimicrobiaceae bacterium]|nr:S-layer homology domain-containing protein [Acidimicrobiaceae bacterium]